MGKQKSQSIYDWKNRQAEHMKKLVLLMNVLRDALQAEIVDVVEIGKYVGCISSKFDLVSQDSMKIRDILTNEDEIQKEFQRIDRDLEEEVYQLRCKALNAISEVKRKEEEEKKCYFEMLKHQSKIRNNIVENEKNIRVNDLFKNSATEVMEEKIIHEKSCTDLKVEKIDHGIDSTYPKMDTIPYTSNNGETIDVLYNAHETSMKNDEKLMKIREILKMDVAHTQLCERDEITKLQYSQIPSHEVLEVCKVETSKNDDGLKNRSYKHEICNEILPEQQEHKDVFRDEPREKGNEISQKKVEDVITITDRFTCDCDSCMCTENDSTSIKELTEDFLDWTKVWLEMCEKSPSVHCNISANKINDGKNIINNENGTKMKESHQNVKKPKKSQKRTTKTKQTKSLNRVQYVQKLNEETRYKMKIKSPKKNGRCKTLEMEYTRWKYMYDKVKSSKNVRSKSKKKKNMNLSSYTSVYRKETEMKSEKIILVNTKMKFRSHRKKLSKFKYRRKKRSIRGHTRTFTIKRVNSRLEKKYISRRLSRSTKKVKLKDRNYYQFIKRCYKLIVLKHRLKKPWKKKTKAKLKRKIIGKKVRDIMILKNGDIGAQGAGKEQQLKFIKYRSICWGGSLVGCGARNGYNRECPKYSLTSLNGGECQILRSSIDEKCSNSWSETVNCRYKIVDVTLMMNVNLAAQIHL